MLGRSKTKRTKTQRLCNVSSCNFNSLNLLLWLKDVKPLMI